MKLTDLECLVIQERSLHKGKTIQEQVFAAIREGFQRGWQAALAQPAQPVKDPRLGPNEEWCPRCQGSGEGTVWVRTDVDDGYDEACDCRECKGTGKVAAPQPAPAADAFEQECADVDAILGELGLDPERMRTESGRLILSRIFEAIRAGRATVEEVPREPTFKMMEAAVGWPVSAAHPHLGLGPEAAKAIWQTMYDAARGKP